MNTNSYCRLCLSKQMNGIPIFSENGINGCIASILTKHCWFLILEEDLYSNLICENCWSIIRNFHEFSGRIYTAQNQLFNNFGKLNLKVSEHPSTHRHLSDIKIEHEDTSYLGVTSLSHNEHIHGKSHFSTSTQMVDISTMVKLETGNEYTTDTGYVEGIQLNFSQQEKHKSTEESRAKKPVTDIRISKSRLPPGRIEEMAEENEKIRQFFKMECDLCKHPFQTFRDARKHFKAEHQQRGYLTCCNRKYYLRCLMLDHTLSHVNPHTYQCDICGKSYVNRYAYSSHMKDHDGTIQRYHCDKCSKTFRKKFALYHHIRMTHYTEDDKKWICDICKKKFLRKSYLHNHIHRVHETTRPEFICDLCGKGFNDKQYLETHRQDHLNIIQPKLQCNVCQKWFKSKDSLRGHKRGHRTAPTECTLCNKMMINQRALNSHILTVHRERTYKCTFCDKAFKGAVPLKEHIASHTGQDLYTCTYCPRTFKSNANMHKHRKTGHPTEWERDKGKRMTLLQTIFCADNDV